jgi:S-(hydroxymethyl)glutathione dehydrogenase/alcohol dehydrogenase
MVAMKVALLRQVGSTTLDVVDGAETVGVGAGEVKVRIGATGVCHTDMSAMTGVLPTQVPVVLGHEGAGEVVEVGPGVAGLAEGDHIVVAWVPPCGVCARCLGGQANVCLQRDPRPLIEPRFTIGDEQAFAFVGCGTMAEEIVVPANSVVKIASDVPWDIASLLGCGVMTGVGAALNAAKVAPGSSVAVFGCGGVGASVIQGARIAGAAEIVAIDPLESKREAMRRFGASHAVGPDDLPEVSRELTGGEGFDYVFEAVGKAAIIRAAYDATRRGGTTCVVGAGSLDDKLELNAMELFAMDKSIVGTLYGSGDVRRDFPMLLRLWRTGRLDLEGMITQRLGLGDVNQALQDMLDGTVIRTVLEMDAA